jgi:hypothetical protein
MLDPLSLTISFAALEGLSAVLNQPPTSHTTLMNNASWAVAYEVSQKVASDITGLANDDLYVALSAAIAAEGSLVLLHPTRDFSPGNALMRFMSINVAKSLLL